MNMQMPTIKIFQSYAKPLLYKSGREWKKRAHRSTYVKNAGVLLTGTPCSISTLGFIIVTSWCRRSGWDSKSSGANSFITSSSCSAAWEGTPYHVLGSPLPGHKHRNEWTQGRGNWWCHSAVKHTSHQQHCPHEPLYTWIKKVSSVNKHLFQDALF